MIKLSEKSRRVLRAIYRGLGVTAVSVLFYGCPDNGGGWAAYGMPPGPEYQQILFHGLVRCKDTKDPIRGIVIYIDDVTTYYHPTTGTLGTFSFYVLEKDNYTVILTDVDGEANGGSFKQLRVNLTKEQLEDTETPLIFEMEKETEE